MGSIADLMLVLFEFSCFAYADFVTYLLAWLNPNQSNRRSAVLPLTLSTGVVEEEIAVR